MRAYNQKVSELLEAGTPFVSVLLVEAVGSTPQDTGSKMLVTDQGLEHGTVGGGKIEARALEEARLMLADPQGESVRFFDWSLNKDIGMTCGGRVRLFFELCNRGDWDIRIFGAGHVAQALVKTLSQINCRITCYDPRSEWLERLPTEANLTPVHSKEMSMEVAGIPPEAFVVLMTMGHKTDLPVLAELLRTREQAYLGVIGSKSKRAVLLRELREFDIPEERRDKFLCPIGLPLGTSHPMEISISIVAQLISERDRIQSERAAR